MHTVQVQNRENLPVGLGVRYIYVKSLKSRRTTGGTSARVNTKIHATPYRSHLFVEQKQPLQDEKG
jgi:hypothetical protein